MAETCSNCRFWTASSKCLRYPPTLNQIALEMRTRDFTFSDATKAVDASRHELMWVFPHTAATEWCGEWAKGKGAA